MNEQSFDAFVRRAAASLDRRSVFGLLGGTVLAGIVPRAAGATLPPDEDHHHHGDGGGKDGKGKKGDGKKGDGKKGDGKKGDGKKGDGKKGKGNKGDQKECNEDAVRCAADANAQCVYRYPHNVSHAFGCTVDAAGCCGNYRLCVKGTDAFVYACLRQVYERYPGEEF